MYDRHPGSAGFFSPSPWGKYLCLRGSKQGTRIPIYCWKLTFLQGNDPQPFLLESQLSLSPPLSLIYSLSPLSSCVYSSLSFLDLPTGTVPFTEKAGNPFLLRPTEDWTDVVAYGSWHRICHVITPLRRFDNTIYALKDIMHFSS